MDVLVLRQAAGGGQGGQGHWEVLCMRRAAGTRSPGTWETIHGHIMRGEAASAAAIRELREETGLVAERFYNLSRIDSFYIHRRDVVALIPVFCAFVAAGSDVRLSSEHDAYEWLAPNEASRRFAWPREARALADALALVGSGSAGGLEDVLRVQ